MRGSYLLVPILAAIVVSMLIVRVGAKALMMTGTSFDKGKFQSLSAFTGTGFTTREAERVLNNPQRRKIVLWMMMQHLPLPERELWTSASMRLFC